MNQQPTPHQLEATDGDGRGLRVRFFWQHDRYVHVIEAIGCGVLPLLASAASEGSADWPDDPPLQQLSIEPVGADRAALGVGQAGRSHWSLSVEGRPGDQPALRFDVACRCTDPPPQRLGSRYRALAGGPGTIETGSGTAWALADGAVRLEVDAAIGPARLAIGPDRHTLRITAGEAEGLSAPAASGARTRRWGFVITSARP